MSKEAMKLALESLEFNQARWQGKDEAITALREALAEQPAPVAKPHEQSAERVEPVAWLQIGLPPLHGGDVIARTTKPTKWNPEWWRFEPLYTTPPQRKPLPPQSPCEMTQAEGKMFRLGWLECEAAHGITGEKK